MDVICDQPHFQKEENQSNVLFAAVLFVCHLAAKYTDCE